MVIETQEYRNNPNETPLANNPHPKDLSKSPAAAGFFVSPTFFCINPYIPL